MKESVINDENCILALAPYIAEIIANPDMSEKVKQLQIDAIIQLKARLAFYQECGYMETLLCAIAKKRAKMIIDTSTKTEMEKVMKIRPPYFDGNKFVSDKYSVPEEEIISWSETSLLGPLNDIGYRRYRELFEQIFPEQAKIILGDIQQ